MFFSKMHGLGNDFIVIDVRNNPTLDYSKLAIKMCNRHLGVGADGLVLVDNSKIADIKMRIINSDGSEAEMCGNGIRCFAKYVFERNIVRKEKFTVETLAGIMEPELILDDLSNVSKVKVNMGTPAFEPEKVPINIDGKNAFGVEIDVDGQKYIISSILMGVPHTVLFVDDMNKVDISQLGPKIERHRLFPKKTNVNFVQIIDRSNIIVRTWERGAGATLACGTGSCASVVVSHMNGYTDKKVLVHLVAGKLEIEWKDNLVYMTGPAEEVFVGEYFG